MILQAYDFLELNKKVAAFSDWWFRSWGNIVNGVDLIKKSLGKQLLD